MTNFEVNNLIRDRARVKNEALNAQQQKEFEQVERRQTEINQQLVAKGFDPSIKLKLKLKPKFALYKLAQSQNGELPIWQLDEAYMRSGRLARPSPSVRCLSLPPLAEADLTCKVSLVIPVYNRAKYLAKAIDSVLAQTYTDFELIIGDDGSTDESYAIAHRYARKDSRIKVFTQQNMGQGAVMVKAISLSRGKYIGQLDSDDWLHPEALSKTVAVLKSNPNLGMVYSNHLVVDAEGNVKGQGNRSLIPYSPQRLLVDFMTFHFRLIRREVYDAVGGYDLDLGTAEDYDLCLKLSEVTEIKHINEPLYYYRWHGDNISTTQHFRQTKCSVIAINRALIRRGLSHQLGLEVKLNPQYILQRQTLVANKVFGIGLSKTGTSSLNQALTLLGIPSIYLPRSLSQIEEFDGASQEPVAVFFKELDRVYPGSKFILTIRNPHRWLKSYQLHEQKILRMYQGQKPAWLQELTTNCYGQSDFAPQQWLKAYARHLKSVTEYFQSRKSDLLIINICGGQGWQELGDFLGCQAPDLAFPHQNKRTSSENI